MRTWLLPLLLLFCIGVARADMIIETIALHHRSVDDVIPVLQPLLSPDASITGTGYKLIIKSTPENIDQIKTALQEIDIDPKRLVVYVSLGTDNQRHNSEVSIQGTTGNDQIQIGTDTNGRNKFDARIYQTERKTQRPTVQTMHVSEGYWASISMGQSVPQATRTRNPDGTVTETVTYQNIMTGYRVMPRTQGDNVTLTIRPQQQSSNDNAGNVSSLEMETTVSGKLGEWIYLGGTDHEENIKNSGITYQTRIRSTDVNQIWVKVERPKYVK